MMHDSNHLEIEELLGAYALDAIEDRERDLVDRHLLECEPCRVEVDGHREVVALLSADQEPAPGRIWELIAGALETPAGETLPDNVVPLQRERRIISVKAFTWTAGVAAAVVVAIGAMAIIQASQIGDLNDQLAVQEQEIATLALALETDPLEQAVTVALDNPSARIATLTAEGASGAMLIVVLPDGTGYVYENTLEQLPDDLTYQLWAVIDEKVISAGVLGNRPDIVPFHIDPDGLQALVITQEVYGGVPQSEGDPVVAWFDA
jgi:anti-sigma factor RsiW